MGCRSFEAPSCHGGLARTLCACRDFTEDYFDLWMQYAMTEVEDAGGSGRRRGAWRMCGIAGMVGRLDPANRAALQRMNDALAHRGPDGEGIWEASADERGWGVMLAHRRLSILDLSAAAAQP